jgi:hypothetical protein
MLLEYRSDRSGTPRFISGDGMLPSAYKAMGLSLAKVTYQGFRTSEGWEVVVKRPGQPLRLLDLPPRPGEWALSLLTNYLDDQGRAADLHNDFAALTIRRFTTDWELTDSDIESVLREVEVFRARLRIALARG